MAGRQGWNEAESRYHSIDWHNLNSVLLVCTGGVPEHCD